MDYDILYSLHHVQNLVCKKTFKWRFFITLRRIQFLFWSNKGYLETLFQCPTVIGTGHKVGVVWWYNVACCVGVLCRCVNWQGVPANCSRFFFVLQFLIEWAMRTYHICLKSDISIVKISTETLMKSENLLEWSPYFVMSCNILS